MKKLLLVLPVLLVVGLFFAMPTLAQEATPSAGEGIYTPRLLPDNPFYFLKTWKEKIEIFLARTPEAKAEKYVEMATRRVAEARQMVEKNKLELVERLMEKHQEHLERAMEMIEEAKEKGKDVEAVLERVTEATSTHLQVLAEVYEKVPEQAKEAIEHAMEVSSRGQERALEAISKDKREEWRQQVEEKIENCLCITLWEPVCGVDDQTYTNSCWLQCAEVEKAYDGPCQGEGERKIWERLEEKIEEGREKLELKRKPE